MDAEFINLYVQKQKDLIIDLISRAIMLETRVTSYEQKIAKMEESEQQMHAFHEEYKNQQNDYNQAAETKYELLLQQLHDTQANREKTNLQLVHLNKKNEELVKKLNDTKQQIALISE